VVPGATCGLVHSNQQLISSWRLREPWLSCVVAQLRGSLCGAAAGCCCAGADVSSRPSSTNQAFGRQSLTGMGEAQDWQSRSPVARARGAAGAKAKSHDRGGATMPSASNPAEKDAHSHEGEAKQQPTSPAARHFGRKPGMLWKRAAGTPRGPAQTDGDGATIASCTQ